MRFNKIKKRLGTCMAGIMLVMSLTACGSGEIGSSTKDDNAASSGEASKDEMFNIALTAPFTGFDPLKTNDSASTYVNAQLYETLYRIDPETGEYNCLLATEYPEFSEDGMSATIKLREGVKFHDGTDFNAEAVKNTFELIKDPEFGSARASIAGSIDTIEVIDDHTLKFNLLYEDGVLLAKLAHTNSAIVSPEAQKSQDLMTSPVGTGPYKFVSSVSGSDVVITRNDAYWGEPSDIKDCTMTIIAEESTAVARMTNGESDFMPDLSVEQVERVEAIEDVKFETSDSAQVYYMVLRGDSSINPVMQNKDFRVALAKGVDSKGYVDNMMDGYATQAKSVIGPKVFGYEKKAEDSYIEYDPEGAKAILDKNPGWADEEITFLVPSTPAYAKIGEFMQASLKQSGFNNIKIESIDWSAWLTESKVDNRFDITLAAWSNVTRDGTELMEPNFHSEVGQKRTRADSETADKIDKEIQSSKTTSDKEVRTTHLIETNNIIAEEAIATPIYHGTNLYCYSKDYTNVVQDAGGTFYLSDFEVVE